MRIRVLELGSNCFQLRGFSVSERGAVVEVWGAKELVRLRTCFDARDSLSQEGMRHAVETVARLLFSSCDSAPLLAVATSAVRAAVNREELIGFMRRRFGFEVRVLSGLEEARLAYVGARVNQPPSSERVAVVDIGGGSTEIAVGDARGLAFCTSARFGALGVLGMSRQALAARLERVLGPGLSKVAELGIERLVFSCGVARALGRSLSASGARDAPETLDVDALRRLLASGALGALGPLAAAVERTWHPTLSVGAEALAWTAARLGFERCELSCHGLREAVAAWFWASRGWSHPSPAVLRALAPLALAKGIEKQGGVRPAPPRAVATGRSAGAA